MANKVIECRCKNVLETQDLVFEEGRYKCKYCNAIIDIDKNGVDYEPKCEE